MEVQSFTVSYGLKRPAGEQFSSHSAEVSFSLAGLEPGESKEDKLIKAVRYLFGLCKKEVESQMQVAPAVTSGQQSRPQAEAPQGGQGNRSGPATEGQIKAILGIGIGLNLSIPALKAEAKVSRFEDLTQSQASNFIKSLKAREAAQQSQNGNGGFPSRGQAEGECPF